MIPILEHMGNAGPKPHPDVVWRRVGDQVVVVNLKTNLIYALNSTGARLWELISAGHDRAAAEAALIEEFDVEEGELRREIAAGLEQLAQAGLIIEGRSPS
jgi:Coenzyme PQQ synthesis protein D (PqqD)